MDKITSRMIYTALIANATDMTYTNDANETVTIPADEIVAFAEKSIASMDKRAAKDKERREAKATEEKEPDALTQEIMSLLTDEYQSIADMLLQITTDGATASKVSARVNALIKSGYAEKTDLRIPADKDAGTKARVVKGYRLMATNA